MPVYLVTLHAYGTWMPDRTEGSVHWRCGYQPPSDGLADAYRARQCETEAVLCDLAQTTIVTEFQIAAAIHRFRPYAIALNASHLHALLGWEDDRAATRIQARLKHSLTQRLNGVVRHRSWFTRGGHRKRVGDDEHFWHLRDVYLPSHRGLRWDARDDG